MQPSPEQTQSLKQARDFAEKFRYSGDTPNYSVEHDEHAIKRIKKMLSAHGLQITQSLTPQLHDILQSVCKNLHVPQGNVSAFVSASSELQAQCYESEENHCIINISSGLIKLLNPGEIAFVMGHEIGHHLLRHNQEDNSQMSVENLMRMRAKEISVDRAGLIACRSLETALRAKMKVISGLPDEYIRFDTSNFINQLRDPDEKSDIFEGSASTHPSLVLRARALLWFTMNDEISVGDAIGSLPLFKIDELVKRDLEKYIDKPEIDRIQTIENDLYFWACAKAATSDGRLTREDRDRLTAEFGDENVNKLISILQEMDISEVSEFLNGKIKLASAELNELAPDSAASRIKGIDQKVKNFKNY